MEGGKIEGGALRKKIEAKKSQPNTCDRVAVSVTVSYHRPPVRTLFQKDNGCDSNVWLTHSHIATKTINVHVAINNRHCTTILGENVHRTVRKAS